MGVSSDDDASSLQGAGSGSDSGSEGSDDGGGFKKFETIHEEELDRIDFLHTARHADGRAGQKFSLAFSGGGIRAAAFQAGVLWRLAEADRLKDVEYFAAVSGGGYITTAFASHCLEAGKPVAGKVRDWYLGVVAKTIARMQDNCGNFVRDCVRDRGGPHDGNGTCPRWLDLPLLLFFICVTVVLGPLCVLAGVVILAYNVDVVWGSVLRADFCNTDTRHGIVLGALRDNTVFLFLRYLLIGVLALQLVVYFTRRRIEKKLPGEPRPELSTEVSIGHAVSSGLIRFALVIGLAIAIPILVGLQQSVEYREDHAAVATMCACFRSQLESSSKCDFMHCDKRAAAASAKPGWEGLCGLNSTVPPSPAEDCRAGGMGKRDQGSLMHDMRHCVVYALMWLILLLPCFGTAAWLSVIQMIMPVALLVGMLLCCQVSVYTRITQNSHGITEFSEVDVRKAQETSLIIMLFLVVFYEKVRKLLHRYYKRTLRQNFFAGGRDVDFQRCCSGENPYVPFVILTGTSTDYQPPGDDDTISELTFSPLHCGSEETGYIPIRDEMTLAKCAALSGAGCLDAITLAMNSDKLFMRFYLELLNLRWGDYIEFFPESRRQSILWCRGFVGTTVWIIIFLLQLFAFYMRREGDELSNCDYSKWLVWVSYCLTAGIIGLSFLNFCPLIDTLTRAAPVRLFHEITSFYYFGTEPPLKLYVTDGGVSDCTGIMPLLWRRRERILLVLANADPEDELRVLEKAMQVAERELQLASFFDPGEPERSLQVTFKEFQEDKSAPYLRLGISYCFRDGLEGAATRGELIVVKNRKLPDCTEIPVRPLLTEEEVATGCMPEDSDAGLGPFSGMKATELGTVGCCDCCHTSGCGRTVFSCGGKWPHGGFTNYLWLTPQFCNNLVRHGRAVSGDAIDAITRPSSEQHA